MPIPAYAIIIGLTQFNKASCRRAREREENRKDGRKRGRERDEEGAREIFRYFHVKAWLEKTNGKLLACTFSPNTKAIYVYCTELGNFKKIYRKSNSYNSLIPLYLSVLGDIISSPPTSKPYAYEFT